MKTLHLAGRKGLVGWVAGTDRADWAAIDAAAVPAELVRPRLNDKTRPIDALFDAVRERPGRLAFLVYLLARAPGPRGQRTLRA